MSHEPIIYLDTNVIRDDTQNRRKSSVHLIAKIRNKELECYTSIFAWMEMIDSAQEEEFVREKHKEGMEYNTICRKRNQIDLSKETLEYVSEKFKDILCNYRFIKPLSLSAEGWDLALHTASNSTISAPDTIHIATAWLSGANLMFTSDEHFKKHGNEILEHEGVSDKLKIYKPDQAQKILERWKIY